MSKIDHYLKLKTIVESKGGKLISTEYTSAHDKIEVEDELGNRFFIAAYSLKNGRWSPFTAQTRKAQKLIKYTINDLINHAKSKGGSILDTEYINDKHLYTWLDSKGRSFKISWHHVIKRGYWSPHEKREKLSLLHIKYTLDDLKNFAAKYNAECLSTVYTRLDSKYSWKDRNGVTFERSWRDVKDKTDLLSIMRSRHETEVDEYIKSLGFKTETNREILKGKEIDILIPDLKIGIEVNGMYWHSEKKGKDRNYHLNKQRDCKKQGYELIQIFDTEWDERKQQIKSFLAAKLGKNTKIGARNTGCCIVEKSVARDFLNKYHIQGSCNFEKAYGLYLRGDLVSLITISNHHRGGDKKVLSRFVGKTGVSVIGGLSKLVKAALNDYTELITWVDLRYSNGQNWIKAGWKVDCQLVPDYVYFNETSGKVIPKQSRRKSVVKTPDNMTEHEHAKLDGLTRVYDCGKLRLNINR